MFYFKSPFPKTSHLAPSCLPGSFCHMCSRAQVSTANHALNHSSVIRSSAAAYLVNLYSSLHSHSDFSPSAAARRHCLSPFFFPIIVQHTPSLSVSSPDHLQHIKIPFFSLQRIAPLPREFLHSCFSLSLSLFPSVSASSILLFFLLLLCLSLSPVAQPFLLPHGTHLPRPRPRCAALLWLQGWADSPKLLGAGET